MAKQDAPTIPVCNHCDKPIVDEYHVQVSTHHVHAGPNSPVMVLFDWHGECYEAVVAPALGALATA